MLLRWVEAAFIQEKNQHGIFTFLISTLGSYTYTTFIPVPVPGVYDLCLSRRLKTNPN